MSVDPTYFIDSHNGWGAFSPCEGCMDLSTCTDSTLVDSPFECSIEGIDPDGGGGEGGEGGEGKDWEAEDISQSNDRTTLTDRWPYQIITAPILNLADYNCNASCAYLITIQYKLKTSSRRRSYLQCGFSDVFVVDKYAVDGATETLMEQFCIGTSVPMIYDQTGGHDNWLQSDYVTSSNSADNVLYPLRWARSNADIDIWFNPYGLREDYDTKKDKTETHCGTLSFFARGTDKIKVRLGQHTQVPWAVDLNPANMPIKGYCTRNRPGQACRYEASHADMSDKADLTGDNKAIYTNTKGDFKIRAFTRPVPGDLWDITKKDGGLTVNDPEQKIKYFPELY